MKKNDNDRQKREIAERIRKIRKNNNMTQEKAAERLDVSISTYKKMEAASSAISVENLKRMKKEMHVSTDYILFGEQKKVDEVWEAVFNCSEIDKLSILFRLAQYFALIKSGQHPSQEAQSIYDEKLRKILEETDI